MAQRQNKVNTNLCDVFQHGHVHNTKLAIASGAAEQNCSSPYILVSHFFSKLLCTSRNSIASMIAAKMTGGGTFSSQVSARELWGLH